MEYSLTLKHLIVIEGIIKRVKDSGKAFIMGYHGDKPIRVGQFLSKNKIQVKDIYYHLECLCLYILFADSKGKLTIGVVVDKDLQSDMPLTDYLIHDPLVLDQLTELKHQSNGKYTKDALSIVPITLHKPFKRRMMESFNNPKPCVNTSLHEYAMRQEPSLRTRLLILAELDKHVASEKQLI